jgi:hypothetical protein
MRKIGRGASEDISELRVGMDFRRPEYRREVFLRFYEFHLEHRSHPGCVYYAMPWLVKKHRLDQEQKLWLAFINGNTQNIVTTWEIFKRFPNCPVDKVSPLRDWFTTNYERLAWDTDRRYHRKEFINSVAVYMTLVGGSQQRYFAKLQPGKGEEAEGQNFRNTWEALRKDFFTFGRLSAFSYSEYLRIMGLPINCPDLFLRDLSGSKSHRNGLAKVLGRDDMDWFRENPGFDGRYSDEEFEWLEDEAAGLLLDATLHTTKNKKIDPREVNYFTLESALCTYKSWHRKNRRYANVYQDMFYERIKLAEERFGVEEVKQFWDCREDCQPKHLLLEFTPGDPGLVPEKQNWYRENGQPVMMSKRWPEFENPFDKRIWSSKSPPGKLF